MPQSDNATDRPFPEATLDDLLQGLDQGHWSSAQILDACLSASERLDEPAHQAYTKRFDGTARAEAEAVDTLRQANVPVGELAGLPIALKALFDVQGEVTHSGSRWWSEAASTDAVIVSRLRRAGAVITGHTNMTEFAYSGLGLNPHYGTPLTPLAPGRISGGSSSGSAVAVAAGMAAAAIGSDTGGSVRIPAAFCGLVGFKPSQYRIPRQGIFPLSDSYDSIGPIARSVGCCARLDAVLSGTPFQPGQRTDVRGLRFVVPRNYMMDDMSPGIARAFDRSLQRLREAGATVVEASVPVLDRLPELLAGGGLTAAEAFFRHRDWLGKHGDEYDPLVKSRIERGALISAADYQALLHLRAESMSRADAFLSDYDGLLAPTVPIEPPLLRDLADDRVYGHTNLLVLRNPTVANVLDLCAITLPNHAPDELPSGLMMIGRNGTDRQVLAAASGVEKVLGRD
ncbi:amidase [Marinobacter santoriniensis]|nr:amidase [Marinobacter santoriniensis]